MCGVLIEALYGSTSLKFLNANEEIYLHIASRSQAGLNALNCLVILEGEVFRLAQSKSKGKNNVPH
jgi:hypothetical protein